MSSRRQTLLARVNWFLQSSLKHITELITGNKSYYRGGRCRQVPLYSIYVRALNQKVVTLTGLTLLHDDVIKWKPFPRYWPFVRGFYRSPVNSPHKGQWRGAFGVFFDLCLNKRFSKQTRGDLRRHSAHCDVIAMWLYQYIQPPKICQFDDLLMFLSVHRNLFFIYEKIFL